MAGSPCFHSLYAFPISCIGSTRKTNDVTKETKLQPLKQPHENTSDPIQRANNAPKYTICMICGISAFIFFFFSSSVRSA
uniref:Transmembrane protein n=1 Tax=Rhizophora mucronata TaxID=61149 RepID=A0A2P2J026_RHIMU